MRQLNIVVACGSGIATSSIAVYKVEMICEEAGVDARIVKTTIKEIPEKSTGSDLVLTTCKYEGESSCPVMSVSSFLTGIGEEEVSRRLAEKLRELAS